VPCSLQPQVVMVMLLAWLGECYLLPPIHNLINCTQLTRVGPSDAPLPVLVIAMIVDMHAASSLAGVCQKRIRLIKVQNSAWWHGLRTIVLLLTLYFVYLQ